MGGICEKDENGSRGCSERKKIEIGVDDDDFAVYENDDDYDALAQSDDDNQNDLPEKLVEFWKSLGPPTPEEIVCNIQMVRSNVRGGQR